MANKRQLKKQVAYICGELASEILLAYHFVDGIDRAAVENIVNEIAELQADTTSKVSFSFDKVVKDFDTPAAYNRALNVYNKAAFAKLREEFNAKVADLVKQMNAAVPAQAREQLKTLA